MELPAGAHARSCTVRTSCAGGGTGTGDAVTRLLITPRLVWQVSGAVARQLGVRAYPTIMWLQLMDEGVTIAEHAGGRDAASLVAFAKAAPGMIEEGVAAQKAKEGKAEGKAEGGAAEGGAAAEAKPEAKAEAEAEGGAAGASKIGQSKVGKSKVGESKVAAKAAEEAAAAAAEPAEGATEGAAAESKVSGSKLAPGAGVEKAATPAEAEAKAEAAPAAAAAAKECATGS